MNWTNPEAAGLLPLFLSEHCDLPAKEQFNTNYQHGGGWHPFHGFALLDRPDGSYYLQYPDDPPQEERARFVTRPR